MNKNRNVIAIGKTGAGKSFILSHLLNQTGIFASSAKIASTTKSLTSMESIPVDIHFNTNKLPSSRASHSLINDIHINYTLSVTDTPGLADTDGKTDVYIDDIVNEMKSKPYNLILIVVEYGKLDVAVKNNLEVLKLCFNSNGGSALQSSALLVVNKVPNEVELEQKKLENPLFDLQKECETFYNGVCEIIKIRPRQFLLKNFAYDLDKTELNGKMGELHIEVLNSTGSVDLGGLKTWTCLMNERNASLNRCIQDVTNVNALITEQRGKIGKTTDSINHYSGSVINGVHVMFLNGRQRNVINEGLVTLRARLADENVELDRLEKSYGEQNRAIECERNEIARLNGLIK